ncbi:hypothetical protein CDAR_36781 [Caerostris darwini]|uniref:Uncharacterized protein n=1 Tax=Caerostris darwini TaxID=1538125 RepID=A0AAV4UV25_9ARAC|nr:hypothetical protein CDAR_36781 [Caerostris darwini]
MKCDPSSKDSITQSQNNAVEVCLQVIMVDCKAEACDSLTTFQVHRNTVPCSKSFPKFVAAQIFEAFAGEVVDGCSDRVAHGPECQWKLRLVG